MGSPSLRRCLRDLPCRRLLVSHQPLRPMHLILLTQPDRCFNARRRRRQGLPPRYGTGWTTAKWGNQQSYYNNQPYNGGAPAPPYSPPAQNYQYTGHTFNSNDGYYGQQSGVELQPPKNTYAGQPGGEPVYEAPQGPPPGKGGYGDGIIR